MWVEYGSGVCVYSVWVNEVVVCVCAVCGWYVVVGCVCGVCGWCVVVHVCMCCM